MFHKSVRPTLTGFAHVFDEINLVFADTRTLILDRMIALRSKTVTHTSLPSFDNANGCCCEESLLRSRKLYYHGNMSSHFPLLLRLSSKKKLKGAQCIQGTQHNTGGSFSEVFDFAVYCSAPKQEFIVLFEQK